MIKPWFCSALLLLASLACADRAEISSEREELSFIACPVYRDTDAGPKSGCWLANHRDSGITFDISAAPSKPLLGKAVLVEGVRLQNDSKGDGRAFCGGVVLQPVRVSILPQTCPEHILPAEGFPSRVFALPADVMRPTEVARELPVGPFENRRYSVLFHFQSDFLNYQYSEVLLEKIALYIKASEPKRVRVVGYSASEPYKVSGQILREDKRLARSRAEMVILALTRLGIDPALIKQESDYSPNAIEHYAGGLSEETKRRVDVVVELH